MSLKERIELTNQWYEPIEKQLRLIESRINNLTKSIEKMQELQRSILALLEKVIASNEIHKNPPFPDVMSLLSLPRSLRSTVLAITKIGEATADDISNETKRLRAVESNCANQLVRMGYLTKKRTGRKVFFNLKEKIEW